MNYQPTSKQAETGHCVPLGKWNARLLTDIKAADGREDCIRCHYIYEVSDPVTKKIVYATALEESRAIPGMLFLCAFLGDKHVNFGRFEPGADADAFVAKAREMACVHLGVSGNKESSIQFKFRVFLCYLDPMVAEMLQGLLSKDRPKDEIGYVVQEPDTINADSSKRARTLMIKAGQAHRGGAIDLIVLGVNNAFEQPTVQFLAGMLRCPIWAILTTETENLEENLRKSGVSEVFRPTEMKALEMAFKERLK
ncbi:MAG: hypothetical protein PHD76_04040 [Methylacidiphilales bacterium]|nr:hypothetical protein [Candidatus Methylacidiphilales bacterium]